MRGTVQSATAQGLVVVYMRGRKASSADKQNADAQQQKCRQQQYHCQYQQSHNACVLRLDMQI